MATGANNKNILEGSTKHLQIRSEGYIVLFKDEIEAVYKQANNLSDAYEQ